MLWYQSGISRNSGLVTLAQLILLLLIIINNIKLKKMLFTMGMGGCQIFCPKH